MYSSVGKQNSIFVTYYIILYKNNQGIRRKRNNQFTLKNSLSIVILVET